MLYLAGRDQPQAMAFSSLLQAVVSQLSHQFHACRSTAKSSAKL